MLKHAVDLVSLDDPETAINPTLIAAVYVFAASMARVFAISENGVAWPRSP